MRIIIDADACPDIERIVVLGKKYNIEVIVVCDNTHMISDDYAIVIILDKGYQSVDMYIVNNIKSDDILITQDYGLAVLCLNKCFKVISTRGYVYSDDNIDSMMYNRHISSKLRRSGIYLKGNKKRTMSGSVKLLNLVEEIIKKCYNG